MKVQALYTNETLSWMAWSFLDATVDGLAPLARLRQLELYQGHYGRLTPLYKEITSWMERLLSLKIWTKLLCTKANYTIQGSKTEKRNDV